MSRIWHLPLLALVLVAPTHAFATEVGSQDGTREQMAATVDGIVKTRAADGQSELHHGFSLASGAMQFEQRGVGASSSDDQTHLSLEKGVNASNGALEWEWFHKKNLATFLGYRLAYNPKIKRTQYQAGFGGMRYFLYTPGVPIVGQREFTRFRYNFKLKPYVEGGVTAGRYLTLVFGDQAALDVSSEFYGVMGGLGAQMPVTTRTSVGLSVTYEYSKGYGPLRFFATTIFAMVGLHYYY